MKTLSLTLFTLLISMTLTANAQANQKQVNGMIIGAGSGAILGQAIGHNTRSTVVGTAVGTMVGYVLGSEVAHNRTVVVHERYQPHSYRDHEVRVRFGRPFEKHHRYATPKKVCRKTVAVNRFHGRLQRRTITTCWTDRRHDFDRHHYDRHHYRRDWR